MLYVSKASLWFIVFRASNYSSFDCILKERAIQNNLNLCDHDQIAAGSFCEINPFKANVPFLYPLDTLEKKEGF